MFRLWSPELDAMAEENRSLAAAITDDFVGDDLPPLDCSDDELLAHQRASMAKIVTQHDDGVDEVIAGRRCRVFVPSGAPTGVVLHFHGGGMAMGSPDMNDHDNAAVSSRLGVAVVSVEYRLAPEHPFPAAIDDAVAVARVLEATAPERFGSDRLVIAGESAGATVAVGCLLRLRDRPEQCRPWVGAVLTFGLYDWSATPSQRGVRPSDADDTLDVASLARFADWYLPGRSAEERRAPAVSPAWADLSGMPAALMTVGTADHLLDDTLLLATRWVAAGNEADLLVLPDAPHGFVAAEGAATDLYRSCFDSFVTRRLTGTASPAG